MKYYIGADHAGIEIKKFVKELFENLGHEVEDLGPYDTTRVDYPDFAQKVCEAVLNNNNSKGILICGSGLGMSMAANKFDGIRAALCHNEYSAQMARQHNDANVLCMGERVSGFGKYGVRYSAENVEDNYILIDRTENRFELDNKIIDSYYQQAEIFYNDIFSVLKSYQVLSVKTSFIYNQHFDANYEKDSKVYLNQVIFNFELGYNGHHFINNNYVQIGIDALTGDITSVKSKLLSIEETGEIVLKSKIDQYVDSLPKENNIKYRKVYFLDKASGKIRPTVISVNLKTTEFKVLKQF